jgi:hypothetical protein
MRNSNVLVVLIIFNFTRWYNINQSEGVSCPPPVTKFISQMNFVSNLAAYSSTFREG